MRTLIVCLILLALSSAYVHENRHHVYSFASEIEYHADRFMAALSGSGRKYAHRKTWEKGGGDRTHTTGHGYYLRRADRGK